MPIPSGIPYDFREMANKIAMLIGALIIIYAVLWISIKVDQVIKLLPKKWYVVAQLFLNAFLFMLFFYLSIHGYKFLMQSIASKQTSPALGLPMPYVQCAPFVGFTLATIRSFQQIFFEFNNIKHLLNHESIEEVDPREVNKC